MSTCFGMKVAYFDCAAGIAGDMCLGALLDCGVPLEYLNQQLQALGIGGEYNLQVSRVQRCGQPALQAVVEVLDGSLPPRSWLEIQALIAGSRLAPAVKARSLKVFEKLARQRQKFIRFPWKKCISTRWGLSMPWWISSAPVLVSIGCRWSR
jgi:uncharacterized protein (DUF111 family)